ncbi:MAG: phage tail tape measure protein [Aquamicrobium sp.]|uniref:phage tail tape measure protein n=1 Tax=Aquamicrobium sp. TaxID=1872579 RepID=UPI00349EB3CB|nr:phage tail tape measure protein [Aquamicrobium sp.]MCO5155582.1 phage tail tape measure protein [Aquamicrobium sp.]
MSKRTVEAVLRLSSKLGNMAAFRQLSSHMEAVDRKAKAVNRSQALIARSANGAYAATARLIAPVLSTAAAVNATKNYAAMDRQLGRIGDTADATVEQTERFGRRMRDLAAEVRMPFQEVVSGVAELAASGKNLDEIGQLMPHLARVAHATGSEFADISTTSDSIANAFGITAKQMETSFDLLAYYGKAGKFELRDMAAELPSLAPAFAALGYRGEEAVTKLAVALQTVRMETGTSGEAATSFMDVLTKMQSETVANNFKKFGIDVRKAMATARRDGKDVLETFKDLALQAVKGDLSKLPQLFTDKQMQVGMRSLINNWSEFEQLLQSSDKAAGTVAEGVKRFSNDGQAAIDALSNSWDRLANSVGRALYKMGGASIMDRVSSDLETGMSLSDHLAGQGMSALQRADWTYRHYQSDDTKQRLMEWEVGYGRDSQREAINAIGEELAARMHQSTVSQSLPADKAGFPIEGPIPMMRPDKATAASLDAARWSRQARVPHAFRMGIKATPTGRYDSYNAGNNALAVELAQAARAPSHRDAERDSMHVLRSDPNGVADAIDEALANGGRKLREEAVRAGEDLGAQGGTTLARSLDGVGRRIGEEAARAFKAGVGTINVNANVSGIGSGVSGNRGTMPAPGTTAE